MSTLVLPEAGALPSSEIESLKQFGFHDEQLLVTAAHGDYPLLSNMREQMIQDFNCSRASDKLLIDTVISEHFLASQLSGQLHYWVGQSEFTEITLMMIKTIGEELKQARRRALAAHSALIAMNQPRINVNIKANQAVIGQHQHFTHHAAKTDQ
jgi:hypothetical protein